MTCKPVQALLGCLLTLPSVAQDLAPNETYDDLDDRTGWNIRLYVKRVSSVWISAYCEERAKSFRNLGLYFQMGDEVLPGSVQN